MDFFFSDAPAFEMFGKQHGISALVFVGLTVFLIVLSKHFLKPRSQVWVGTALALLTTIAVIFRMYVAYAMGTFTLQEDLPLYICRIVTFVIPFTMYFKHRSSFGVLYFWVLAGTLNALITPDLAFGFPHFDAWIYWILHGGLITTVLYAVFVYGLKPTGRDIVRALIIANVYVLFVHIINWYIGSNYSYTMHKPPASLLDAMGPWPWYLLTTQALAAFLFALLYLPFFIQARRTRVSTSRS